MNLQDYIFKTKKTYPFKIGIADNSNTDLENELEQALQKYGVNNFSSGKTTPVQAKPLDFPQLSNTSATYWEVELNYPTYPESLRTYIGEYCRIPVNQIVVRHPDEPIEEYQTSKETTEYVTLLTQTDMGGESAQELVGQNRVMELLKELEKDRNKETS